VTAATIDSSGTFFAGSYDGRIITVTTNGTVEPVSGPGHSNHVSGIATSTKQVYSVGYDDTIRQFSAGKFSYDHFKVLVFYAYHNTGTLLCRLLVNPRVSRQLKPVLLSSLLRPG
jgi:hypothetical protein